MLIRLHLFAIARSSLFLTLNVLLKSFYIVYFAGQSHIKARLGEVMAERIQTLLDYYFDAVIITVKMNPLYFLNVT